MFAKDGHGGVSSLLLMVDFRGGPVWHIMNYWIIGRPSIYPLATIGCTWPDGQMALNGHFGYIKKKLQPQIVSVIIKKK